MKPTRFNFQVQDAGDPSAGIRPLDLGVDVFVGQLMVADEAKEFVEFMEGALAEYFDAASVKGALR